MVQYNNIPVFTSGLGRKASAIVCVKLAQRLIPYMYFLGLDTRERHFRWLFRNHSHGWRGDQGGLGEAHFFSGLYNVVLDGINQIGVVFGRIGVGEACPCGKVSYLDVLDPCGLYWVNGSPMELADKGLDTREVIGDVGGEQSVFLCRAGPGSIGLYPAGDRSTRS